MKNSLRSSLPGDFDRLLPESITKSEIAFILTDPGRNVVWFNQAFGRLSGCSLSDAVGRNPSDLINATGRGFHTVAEIRKAMVDGRDLQVEVEVKRKDGTLVTIMWRVAHIGNNAGDSSFTAGAAKDISRIPESEKRAVAENLYAELSLFIGAVQERIG